MIVFNYKKEHSRTFAKLIYRPVAEIYLKSQSEKLIRFDPYIDSGADITLLPYSLGKLLGLEVNRKKVEEITGIKGSVPVVYDEVDAGIGEFNFKLKVAWAQVEEVPSLLGRKDVFDFFNVTFKQKSKIIIFEKS